jgi:hypothetical protein
MRREEWNAYHALQESGCASQQHLGDTESGCRIPVFGGEIALKHPDALAQPRNQFEVICSTSEQSLGRVHVSRNQAGDYNATGQVDFFFMGMFDFEVAGYANVSDSVAIDEDSTVGEDRPGGVNSHDGGVCEEHFGW